MTHDVIVSVDAIDNRLRLYDGTVVDVPNAGRYTVGSTQAHQDECRENYAAGKSVYRVVSISIRFNKDTPYYSYQKYVPYAKDAVGAEIEATLAQLEAP